MGKIKNVTGITWRALLIFYAVFSVASGQEERVNVKSLFEYHCAVCHGADGRGTKRGHALKVPDFSDSDWQATRTDAEILNSLVNGKDKMPRWSDKLEPEEIQALAGYVRLLAHNNNRRK